jgi:NADH-quinone oxidoreductase subunit G
MDAFADEVVCYEAGAAPHFMANLTQNNPDLAKKLADAKNLVIVVGAEGLSLDASRALSQAAANFLIESGHVGKKNNGFLATLPGPNGMGQHYTGFTPEAALDIMQNPPKALIIAQADVMADDPAAASWLSKVETVIDLSLFPDGVVQQFALAALPIQSFAERDGTFTNGERRVQRFYTAQGPMGDALPAWQVLGRLGEALGLGRAKLSAAAVMLEMSKTLEAFAGMTYRELSKVARQFPDVGGNDLYYGGTAYQNKGGLGVQIASAADNGAVAAGEVSLPEQPKVAKGEMLVIPTTRLYNRERTFRPSALVHPRVLMPYVEINAADAQTLGIANGDVVEVSFDNGAVRVKAHVNGGAPQGAVVLPRHLTDEAVPMMMTAGKVAKV